MDVIMGIYCIENLINGKKYIGQSYNIGKRRKEHFSKSGSRGCPMINKAIKKYGIDNFYFSIIEECELELLDEREVYWIKELHSHVSEHGYNISWGGNTPQRGRKHTEEELQKMREANRNTSGSMAPNYGKKFTEEHKRKMSENSPPHKGQLSPAYGRKHTEEEIKKMKQNHVYYSGELNPCYGMHPSEETLKKRSESLMLRKNVNSSSQYIGVMKGKYGRWISCILGNYLGSFMTEIEAALATNEFLLEEFGWKVSDKINKINQEQIDNIWNLNFDDTEGEL